MKEPGGQHDGRPRILVFGISGATWDIASGLMEEGRLPHLKSLVERGVHGELQSLSVTGDKHYRPQTAWSSIATGVAPDRTGISAFYHTADDFRRPCLWDVLQEHGWSVGLFNWPITWPPREVRGFNVPGYDARDTQTWPPELAALKWLDRQQRSAQSGADSGLEARLSEMLRMAGKLWRAVPPRSWPALGLGLVQAARLRDARERTLLVRAAKVELGTSIFSSLCRRYRPNFASFHSFLVDFVSHRYWRYRDPERFGDDPTMVTQRLRNAVDEAYVKTDKHLGRVLAAAGPDTLVAVLSEHGMAAEPQSAEVGSHQVQIRGGALAALIGLEQEVLVSPVARWVALRPKEGTTLDPGLIARRTRAIRVAETGLPLFRVHEHGPETVVKLALHRDVPRYGAGDLASLTLEYEDLELPFEHLTRALGPPRSAMHDARALLVLSGPGIRRGQRIEGARLVDVMPTLLEAVGQRDLPPVDGRALDVFT